ncbi:FAD-dependent oxidoreductase [Actinoplanes sp. N902-109]|uniref:FAD-dependent oxidoreductase n=1 Tax=Actinoplanes sp. (strain N902-109) TaxID=649831 RepID=UPI0005A1734A|nr:FAD-dependent oxidoreductase [Actinoplanes sp. N902-109]
MSVPARVAVVGSGPAGVYTVDALTRSGAAVSIDVFDRLPTPYGLVRYGVAPDQKVKAVATALGRILERPGVRFLGNVGIGADISVADLRRRYAAVVIATGAPIDRPLGIPGETLPGSCAAGEFVSWYNGHPDRGTEFRLTMSAAAVVGAGNVALDVARMLVKQTGELVGTDVPDEVGAVLRERAVTDVYVLGRRGPESARFTLPELRNLERLDNVDVLVDPADLGAGPDPEVAARLRLWSQRAATGADRRIHLMFWRRPVEIVGESRVEALLLEDVRTGEVELLPVGAVFHAVGFRGEQVPGVPFDPVHATVPTTGGRVTGSPGLYAVGWARRGPSGVIGSTKVDAAQVARALLADLPELPHPPDPRPEAITELLTERGVRYVTWEQWKRLDEFEIARGQHQGRPRAKLQDRAGMLAVMHGDPVREPRR